MPTDFNAAKRVYQVHCKVTLQNHNRVEHYASLKGQSMNDAASDLIERGIEGWENEQGEGDLPERVRLARDVQRLHKQDEIFLDLVALAASGEHKEHPQEFADRCVAFGFTADEVIKGIQAGTEQRESKHQLRQRDQCRWLMRGALLREPEGIPTENLLRLASACGFSRYQTYRSLNDIEAENFNVGRTGYYRLPVAPFDSAESELETESEAAED